MYYGAMGIAQSGRLSKI